MEVFSVYPPAPAPAAASLDFDLEWEPLKGDPPARG